MERAAVQFGWAAGERQAKAGALVSARVVGLYLTKGFKADFDLFCGQPRPGIAHVEQAGTRSLPERYGAEDRSIASSSTVQAGLCCLHPPF
jgi:hypothetical protein